MSSSDRTGPVEHRPVTVAVALEVRRDASGRDTARVLVAERGLDFGVVLLEDVPLLLEALLADAGGSS